MPVVLPELPPGNYRQYKEDTDRFLTWLSNTAITCGWSPSNLRKAHDADKPEVTEVQKQPRLKGRARKEAKIKAESQRISAIVQEKCVVTTQDLLIQAQSVASAASSSTKIPKSILRVLERTIKARKRFNEWFELWGELEATSRRWPF